MANTAVMRGAGGMVLNYGGLVGRATSAHRVGMAGCVLPVRRALRIQPTDALRAE
mgnify:CR=1 FL=1